MEIQIIGKFMGKIASVILIPARRSLEKLWSRLLKVVFVCPPVACTAWAKGFCCVRVVLRQGWRQALTWADSTGRGQKGGEAGKCWVSPLEDRPPHPTFCFFLLEGKLLSER